MSWSKEPVEGDRQGADTPAGGVEDRVGDGGGHAGQADPLDPDRVEPVGFADKITSSSGTSALTGTR
jgi:hypothetical protein